MAYRWFKVYIEILGDPKMGRLPDRLWRRTLEMFALAKSVGDSGDLPPLEDMAWTLHMEEDALEADLMELAAMKRPIVQRLPDGSWFVTRFAKRQAPEPDEVRKAAQRERDRKKPEPVTDESRSVTATCLDLDLDVDPDKTKTQTETETSADVAAPAEPPVEEKPAKKARAPKEPKQPPPEAIERYRAVVLRYPHTAVWRGVAEVVGHDPPELDFWERVVRAWIACGWNPQNVKGMLQFYLERKLPGSDNGHGRTAEPKSLGVLREYMAKAEAENGDGG